MNKQCTKERRKSEQNDNTYTEHAFKNSTNVASAAVRGGGAIAASRIIGQVVQVASTMVLARLLTPDDFGLVAMAVAVVGILHIFNDLGFVDASIQSETLSDEQASNLFWLNVFINLGFFIFLGAISIPIARFYNETRVIYLLIILSTELVFLSLGNQHFALLKREMHFEKVAIVLLISIVVSNILGIIAALLGVGYWALVVRQVSMPAIRAIMAWLIFRWKPKRIRGLKNTMSLFWFGAKTSASLMISHLSMTLPRIFLGRTVGTTGLAYYDRSYSLMMLPVSQLTTSFHHVAIATLRRYRHNPEIFKKQYLRAISTLAFVSMPIGSTLAVLSEDVILLFLGPGWEKAVPILFAFSITIGLRVIYMTNSWLHVSLGKAKRRVYWEIFTFCLIMVGVLIALQFGLNEVAWVIAGAPAVLVFPGLVYAGKPIGLSLGNILKKLWRGIVSASISGFLLSIVMNKVPEWSSLFRFLAGSLLGMIFYIILIVILNGSLKPIREFFNVLLKLRKMENP